MNDEKLPNERKIDDEKFSDDAKYTVENFPIKINLKMSSDKNLSGGDGNDFQYILSYLNNSSNKYAVGETDDKTQKFVFELIDDKEINKKTVEHTFNYIDGNNENVKSIYINNGLYSSAIAVKLIESDFYNLNDKILVLKVLGTKKYDKNGKIIDIIKLNEWNKRYYLEQYKNHKNLYPNLLLEYYFYGNNLINEKIDISKLVNIEYKNFYNNKYLSFNISKYYKSPSLKNMTIEELKIFILKTSAVILFFNSQNMFLNDVKYDNIGCDENNNLIIIDYEASHYKNFYKYKNNDLFEYPILELGGVLIPTFLKKKFFLLLKDKIEIIQKITKKRSEIIKQKSLLKETDIKDFIKEHGNIIYRNLTNNIVENIYVENVIKKKLLSDNIGIDKYNSLGLFQILLTIFFAPFENISPFIGEGNLKSLVFGYTIKNKKGKILSQSNPHIEIVRANLIFLFSAYDKLNDIFKLNELVNDFLEPFDETNSENVRICERLKKLFFDNVSETGLLAPEYDDIPPFDLVFKYLFNSLNYNELLNNKEMETKENIEDIIKINYNDVFLQLIKENIMENITEIIEEKTKEKKYIISNITDQDYDEWILKRIEIKTKTKYEDNNNTNNDILLIPPINTKYINYYENIVVKKDKQIIGGYSKNFENKYLKYKKKYFNLINDL